MSGRIIPCSACNMLAYDEGITYEDLVEAGAIVEGEMVRHLRGCFFAEEALPVIFGRSGSVINPDLFSGEEGEPGLLQRVKNVFGL